MSTKRYAVMVVDWQTEDEIFTYYVQAEAYAQARYLADTYGTEVDVFEELVVKEGENEVVAHHVVSPSKDSKPTRSYYWDTQGKYLFAQEMED